jgi:pimeloyl-ACP methyl ester carboxylesterase
MNDAIHPFRIEIPQADIDDLHARLDRIRRPARVAEDDGWSRGIPQSELDSLVEHWRDSFDWRAQEAALNELPQFVTEIEGQRIHFVHVRSERADALPLLVTHGYPSSFVEFTRMIEDLVDPDDGQAFHVVAPSLPGYGFSTPLASPGWTMGRTARAWAELMARLGYDRYGVHGGDVGAGVSGMLAALDGEHVIGCHVVTDPVTAANTATFIPGMADRLDADDPVDKLILERMEAFTSDGSGYLSLQQTRPQTIGYGLVDSPVLQLAWIAEKFHEWTQLPVDRDQLLTNVSIYWFTGAGASAAHTLYDQAHAHDWGGPADVPQGFAVFSADETVRKLVPAPAGSHWTEFDHAGHFPTMEAPADVVADLRAFFGPLR